ncbi:MAG: HNH endonuclease [Patescibacteria group bacterium]|jgi:hypothetical protein
MIKINRPNCPNPLALQTNYKDPVNKKALLNASFGKCMYCESKIGHVYFGDVEHIKPKSVYSDLTFDWLNLGYVCAKCNNSKKDKFYEETPYINPYDENPDDFLISLGSMYSPRKGSERGEITILDIELNRPELIEKRLNRLGDIEKALNACMRTANEALKDNALKAIIREAETDKEYSYFVKTYLELQGVV